MKKMNAGKSLKNLMLNKDISRDELANKLKVSSTTITALRNNEDMSSKNLRKVSSFFKMSVSDFIKIAEYDSIE